MNSIHESNELREFAVFLNAPNDFVCDSLTRKITRDARKKIGRHLLAVCSKLISIHAVMSLGSLLVCHQFGLNPFGTSISISDYFMEYGHSTCMVLCGFLFLGGSLFAARVALSNDDFAIIKRSFPLYVTVLCSMSLFVFMMLGAHLTISLGILWALGAFFGAALPVIVPTYKTAAFKN